mgnify:CR=1 FL=1
MKITDELARSTGGERTFFDLPPAAAANHSDDEATLDMKFAQWLDQNQHVLRVFVDRALAAQAAGRTRIGAKRLVEAMRWDTQLTTQGDEFRLNNNYVSRLARAAVKRRPELASLFEFRELRS